MKKNIFNLLFTIIIVIFSNSSCCGKQGICSLRGMGGRSTCVYDRICRYADTNEEVNEITYMQFKKIRVSPGAYVLLDVLSTKSYDRGHIPGSRSFPLGSITEKSAQKLLDKDDRIIVYSGSFSCKASTKAALKLLRLGYTVLDYKGGLKEWKAEGNILEEG